MFAERLGWSKLGDFLWSWSGAAAIVGAFLACFVAKAIWTVIFNVYFHALKDFPGPISRTGLLTPTHYTVWQGEVHRDALRLHEKYGDVVRITPFALSFRTAQAMKDIYGAKPGPGRIWKDPMFYKFSSSNDIINADDTNHARFRRLMSHAFSDSAIQQQEGTVQPYFDLLVRRLYERIEGPEAGLVDLVSWYNWTTFDIVGDLTFGEPFEALQRAQYHPWITLLFRTIKFGTQLGRIARAYPWMRWTIKHVMLWTPSIGDAQKQHISYTRDKTLRRLEAKTDRKDFMSYILRHNDERGMTNEEIINNASILIIAGSETTATLLSGATFRLLTNPRVLRKVQNEVRSAFSSADEMTFASTGKLPYLHAVLEESLRMYPPVPSFLPRRCGENGNMIDGRYVPPFTIVGFSHFAAYHTERNFHDPEVFVPERWVENPPEEYRNDELAALKPFSFGPRSCLGQHLAYMEMSSILARILWHFDMELCEESRDWANQKVYALWQKPPLKVKLSKRFKP